MEHIAFCRTPLSLMPPPAPRALCEHSWVPPRLNNLASMNFTLTSAQFTFTFSRAGPGAQITLRFTSVVPAVTYQILYKIARFYSRNLPKPSG